ncbi:MAG TPA: lipopolysaccharide biosynthesis protein [Solirubrobacteraceae bacterium]
MSHSSVYVVSGIFGFVSVLAQVVVLTRLLPAGEYGDFAVLLLYSGFVALVAGLGVAQGTIISAFSGGDEEGMVEEEAQHKPVTDNRGVLTTGVLVTLINGTVLTALSYALVGPLGDLLLDDRHHGSAIVWATAFGGLAPAWRMASAIPRFERRPRTYLVMAVGNHVTGIAGAAWLVVAGHGVTGVAAGMALSRLFWILVGLGNSRHRFRRTFQLKHARAVFKRGLPYAGLVLSFFFSRNVELFVLSHYVHVEKVASYQVAARLALIPGFALSATLMAWGPLARGPIRAALEKQDRMRLARSRLVLYYLMLAIWIVVAGALLGDVLVQIAPAEYADAARILPLLLLASALHAGLILIFRMAMIPRGIQRLRTWALVSVVIMVGGSLLIVPRYGSIGAAALNAAVPLLGVSLMFFFAQRGKNPLIISGRQVLGILLVAGACVGAGELAHLLPGAAEVPAELALVLAFPVLLLATNVFPRREARQLLSHLRPSRARSGSVRRQDLCRELGALPPADIELLEALLRRDEPVRAVADRLETTEDDVCRQFVKVLRTVSGTGAPGPADAKIGRTMVVRTVTTKRDQRAYMLAQDSRIPPLDLDRLMQAIQHLRRLRPRAWAAARRSAREEASSELIVPAA